MHTRAHTLHPQLKGTIYIYYFVSCYPIAYVVHFIEVCRDGNPFFQFHSIPLMDGYSFGLLISMCVSYYYKQWCRYPCLYVILDFASVSLGYISRGSIVGSYVSVNIAKICLIVIIQFAFLPTIYASTCFPYQSILSTCNFWLIQY